MARRAKFKRPGYALPYAPPTYAQWAVRESCDDVKEELGYRDAAASKDIILCYAVNCSFNFI